MDIELKKNLLKNLAQKGEDTVKASLRKELDKINSILEKSVDYFALEEQLDLLAIIAFRVVEESIVVMEKFLKRLNTIKLVDKSIIGISRKTLNEMYNPEKLILKSFNILSSFWYSSIDESIKIFFKYSLSSSTTVRSKANECISLIASYNIELYKTIGFLPQKTLIAYLKKIDLKKLCSHMEMVNSVCDKMLSSTMESAIWGYNDVTLHYAPIPITDEIKIIRKDCLNILTQLYLINDVGLEKNKILNVISRAIESPRMVSYSDEVLNLIIDNTHDVLNIYLSFIAKSNLNELALIEESIRHTYSNFSNNKLINDLIFEIKDHLDSNDEYKIYKYLVQPDPFLVNWDQQDVSRIENLREIEQIRLEKAELYAASINENNFPLWEKRIEDFSAFKFNDMAAFVYFDKFLFLFSKMSPVLAVKLLDFNLGNRMVPIMRGIWETSHRDFLIAIINKWIEQGKNLYEIVWIFGEGKNIEINLLKELLTKATMINDIPTLASIIAIVIESKGESTNQKALRAVFLDAVTALTKFGESKWVSLVWYRKNLKEFLSHFTKNDFSIILDNLVISPIIDFHIEEIIYPIAIKFPEMVMAYFKDRLDYASKAGSNYDAIPYEFHTLQKVLSQHPNIIIDNILSWNGQADVLSYSSARLVSIIFPNFYTKFESKLFELIETKNIRNIKLVLKVLRSYKGQEFLYPISMEIVRVLEKDDPLLSEVEAALYQTGVVSGEYGFVGEFKSKKEIIKRWGDDKNSKVKDFVLKFQAGLDLSIERETRRADEDIALRKHQYGVQDDVGDSS